MITELRVQNYRSIADSGTLAFGPITVIVGANNSGKSSLLRSLYLLQQGNPWSNSDLRIATSQCVVDIAFDALPLRSGGGQLVGQRGGLLQIVMAGGQQRPTLSYKENITHQDIDIEFFPDREPQNLIYPVFTRQWPVPREEQVRRESTSLVRPDATNLIARVSTMSDTRVEPGREFASLYQQVLGPDMKLSVLTGDSGQQIGTQVDRFTTIGLDSMGTGVGTVLNMLVSLTGTTGKIFLVEEPENDLHPKALKALLDIIAERSTHTQFVITTHSNIVLTRLGALGETRVIEVSSDNGLLPTSSCRQIVDREGRLKVLRDLGFEMADMDLAEGWLIFEESSAERLCRSYLIPWFAPKLARLQTVAAAGTSRVSTLVKNLCEMVLFTHLELARDHRAWVVVDGDASGQIVVEGLRQAYKSWPPNRFQGWDQAAFERFYPYVFGDRVEAVLAKPHDQQREPKRELLNDVIDWIDEDPERAKSAFAVSAAAAIKLLQQIEEAFLNERA